MTTADLLRRAIEALPAETSLAYVGYADSLCPDQAELLLDGDWEGFYESTWEWESEERAAAVSYYLEESGLDADEREALRDDMDAWAVYEEACVERDTSDWVTALARQTRVTLRYYLDHDVTPGSWSMSAEEQEEEARGIADAAGIDYAANERELYALVREASYGGSLVVLHDTRLDELLAARYGDRTTARFTDPVLLVYDGLNGSGHMEEVTGTVTASIAPGQVAHDTGRMSWSEGIAGIVPGSCDTPVEYIDVTTKEKA